MSALLPENDFRVGDGDWALLRKILGRLGETQAAVTQIPAITAEDPAFAASQLGLVNGREAVVYHVIARRAGFNSVSVFQDVAEFLGTSINAMPELNGTESLEVVSASANDASGGTGINSVQIGYIGVDYVFATANATLNGTTPVALPFKSRQILWMEALTVGTNTVAVGNIILRIVGPGATHEQITAGGNKSLSSHMMVPDGWSAFIQDWQVTAIGTATQDARLRATVTTGGRLLGSAYVFQDNVFVSANTATIGTLPWLRYPARTRIKISTFPSATAAQNRIDADYSIVLVKD